LALLRGLDTLADDAEVEGVLVRGVLDTVRAALPSRREGSCEARDAGFLTGLGVPAGWLEVPWDWPGWTAGALRRGVAELARKAAADPQKVLARAVATLEESVAYHQARACRLGERARRLGRQEGRENDRAVRRGLLPGPEALEAITRYEAHLGRQLTLAL